MLTSYKYRIYKEFRSIISFDIQDNTVRQLLSSFKYEEIKDKTDCDLTKSRGLKMSKDNNLNSSHVISRTYLYHCTPVMK